MKKISIIIPCYNVEKYIDRCLTSVIDQSIGLDNLEIICIDDCSTDKTLDRLLAWEDKYSENILIVKHDFNLGQSTARNSGLKYASCDYVAFIDADDWVEKDYIKSMHDIAFSGDYDLVQCEFIRDSSETLSYDTAASSEELTGESFTVTDTDFRKKIITNKIISSNAPFKLIKRSVITDNSISFYDGLFYEDIAFGLLLSLYSNKIYLLHRRLYHYYVNSSSTVLKKNESYHTDILTNWLILWEDLSARGFMTDYRDEFELEFVYSGILIFWKIMVLRYDIAPYSYYRLLCQITSGLVPNIMNNFYISNHKLSEFHTMILSSCLTILNKNDFYHLADNIRKIGL